MFKAMTRSGPPRVGLISKETPLFCWQLRPQWFQCLLDFKVLMQVVAALLANDLG